MKKLTVVVVLLATTLFAALNANERNNCNDVIIQASSLEQLCTNTKVELNEVHSIVLCEDSNANCYTSETQSNVKVWVGNDGNVYGSNKNSTSCDVAIQVKFDDNSWSDRVRCSMNARTRDNLIYNAHGTAACLRIIEVLVQPN